MTFELHSVYTKKKKTTSPTMICTKIDFTFYSCSLNAFYYTSTLHLYCECRKYV